jgi:hypothetical protein
MAATGKWSPDGSWWWDGAAWNRAVSEDRNWHWSGSGWIAASLPESSDPVEQAFEKIAFRRHLPGSRASPLNNFLDQLLVVAVTGGYFALPSESGAAIGSVAHISMALEFMVFFLHDTDRSVHGHVSPERRQLLMDLLEPTALSYACASLSVDEGTRDALLQMATQLFNERLPEYGARSSHNQPGPKPETVDDYFISVVVKATTPDSSGLSQLARPISVMTVLLNSRRAFDPRPFISATNAWSDDELRAAFQTISNALS